MSRLLRSTALAAAFLIAPAWIHGLARAEDDLSKLFVLDEPLVLPDSDTSSIGQEMLPDETPFMLRCTTAEDFNAMAKSLNARGMIVGEDMLDNTLVMVFRYNDGSINFVRSDRKGNTVCIFGQIAEPDIDIGTVLTPRIGKGEPSTN